MTMNPGIIDFTELVSAVPGEGLEELTRLLARKLGLSSLWTGRGSDQGKDLILTEILSGPLYKSKITWLVSCKDKAKSGESVTERDLPATGIKDKLAQHKADGFLLVTTTTVSTGAKALLDGLDKSNGGDIHTLVWGGTELTAMLLESSNQDILKQFLPHSFQKVRGLTSIEGAILAFREQLPNDVLVEVLRLVKPFADPSLKGAIVWPYDTESSSAIDSIFRSILDQDYKKAVQETEKLGDEAFIAFITSLYGNDPAGCYEYLIQVVCNHSELDMRFNAIQFLFDNYEVSPQDVILLATHLDSKALKELYGAEIIHFVRDELYTNAANYDLLYGPLDELSSATQIENIDITDLTVGGNEGSIVFSGDISVEATLVYDHEEMGSVSFPGEFSGYFDEHGMYLESASVNTNSFYG